MTVVQELKKQRNAKLSQARALHRKITDDTPEADARKIEREFNILMGEVDDLREQIEEAAEAREADPRRPAYPDAEARDSTPPEEMKEAYALRGGDSFTAWTRRNRQIDEDSVISPGRYLRALVLGAKDDAERRALAGGTDAAGGYTVPEITSARLIDLMRENMVLSTAGAQTVPLTSDEHVWARLASDPVPAWRAENDSVSESEPTFSRVVLKPKSLAVMVKASVELMEDSLNMEQELPRILARALAVEVDRVGLAGSGSGNEPLGITGYSGLTANAFGGGALESYTPLITARTALHGANERLTGYVMSPRDEGAFAGMVDSTGQPLRKPEAIANTPMLWTGNMPTDGGAGDDESQIIAGDWSQLMIGLRSQIRIVTLRERFMDNLQFGFIAHARVDFAATRDSAFTVLDGITG